MSWCRSVAVPCGSLVEPGRLLEGTRIDLTYKRDDAIDLSIISMGSPTRYDGGDGAVL